MQKNKQLKSRYCRIHQFKEL